MSKENFLKFIKRVYEFQNKSDNVPSLYPDDEHNLKNE
jgi:hypothetical protein